jgi:hypothetical protein
MPLPDRAAPLLSRLYDFIQEPAVAPFLREAADRFAGAWEVPTSAEAPEFLDYAVFSHRDAKGRTGLDLFFEALGDGLDPEEREAYLGFRDSVFGIFAVEEVRPGEGLELRRCGTDERLQVVEESASKQLRPGDGIITRAIPYRGRHEIAGMASALTHEVLYLTDRAILRRGGKVGPEMEDPLVLRKLIQDASEKRLEQPETLMDAEVSAASVFAEAGFPFTVEDVQARFQAMRSPLDLLGQIDMKALRFKDMEYLQRFQDALSALWNMTPRREFGGLSPEEKHRERHPSGFRLEESLIHDLMDSMSHELGSKKLRGEAATRKAMRKAEERWYRTAQEELGGRAHGGDLRPGAGTEAPRPLPPPRPPGARWAPRGIGGEPLLRAGSEGPRGHPGGDRRFRLGGGPREGAPRRPRGP